MDRRLRRYWWIEAVGVIVVLLLFWLMGQVRPSLSDSSTGIDSFGRCRCSSAG